MKRQTKIVILTAILIFILAACGGAEPSVELPVVQSMNGGDEIVSEPQSATSHETMVDEQGNVSVSVTPINLSDLDTSLDFEVVMDTHSIDLGMDLATLATISMDNGRSVSASLWDATPGGHHVSGVLSFPVTVDDAPLLDDATRLTMTIRDVDVPERIFTWDVVN